MNTILRFIFGLVSKQGRLGGIPRYRVPRSLKPAFHQLKKDLTGGTGEYRSEAEEQVAAFFEKRGIPFEYEPLIGNKWSGGSACPDFLFKVNGKVYVHEHAGMWNHSDPLLRAEARRKYRREIAILHKHYPEDRVIVTFDSYYPVAELCRKMRKRGVYI